jgi:hypothetical protein
MSSVFNSAQTSAGGPFRPNPDAGAAPSSGPSQPVPALPGSPPKGSGQPTPAKPAANDPPATVASAPTPYFKLENDKSPCATSSYSIGNTCENTLHLVSPPSPANDAGPADQDDDPLPSTFYDVIPAPLLARTSFTTAGSLSSESVPKGVNPPGDAKHKRRYAPAEVLEMRRADREAIADSIAASIADDATWGRETDSRLSEWVERMRKCSKGAYFMPHPHTGRKIITNFWGCKVRVCPICSWRASIRKACKYTPRITAYLEAHPTYRLRFVTLTDRSVPMTLLKAQCERLHLAFARFCKALDHAFVGYLRCTDIDTCTRDPDFSKFVDGHWQEAPMFVRPHIHAILIQRPKNGTTHVSDSQIEEVWAGAMGSKILLDTHIKDVDAAFGAIKYGAKGVAWAKAEGDFNYAAALAVALNGVRCSAVGGVLRGGKKAA